MSKNMNNAYSYLETVKKTFENRPEIYDKFLEIMKNFKQERLAPHVVITEVEKLFKGHEELLEGFQQFLPGSQTTQQPLTNNNTSVNGGASTAAVSVGSSNHSTNAAAAESVPNGVATTTTTAPANANGTTATATANSGGGGGGTAPERPQDFEKAVDYVSSIKARFSNEPQIYHEFLRILQSCLLHSTPYQSAQMSANPDVIKDVQQKIKDLFAQDDDLLQKFGYFLPASLISGLRGLPTVSEENNGTPFVGNVPHSLGGIHASAQAAVLSQAALANANGRTVPSFHPNGAIPPSKRQRLNDGTASSIAATVGDDMSEGDDGSVSLQTNANGNGAINRRKSRKRSRDEISASNRDQSNPQLVTSKATSASSNHQFPRTKLIGVAMFEQIKPKISHSLYKHILILTQLYPMGLCNFNTVCDLIVDTLDEAGHTDLVPFMRRQFQKNDPSLPQRDKEKTYYDYLTHNSMLKQCQKVQQSYRRLPSNVIHPRMSGRTPLARSVLNDLYVSKPTGSEGPEGQNAMALKNRHHEDLLKNEDDMFELDMMIEANKAARRHLQLLYEQRKDIQDSKMPNLCPQSELELPPIEERAIKRLYGDHGKKIMSLLKKSPVTAIPVVLRRLQQKEEEWERIRRETRPIWHTQALAKYYKAHDFRHTVFKQADSKRLGQRNLVQQIMERHQRRKDDPNFGFSTFKQGDDAARLSFNATDDDENDTSPSAAASLSASASVDVQMKDGSQSNSNLSDTTTQANVKEESSDGALGQKGEKESIPVKKEKSEDTPDVDMPDASASATTDASAPAAAAAAKKEENSQKQEVEKGEALDDDESRKNESMDEDEQNDPTYDMSPDEEKEYSSAAAHVSKYDKVRRPFTRSRLEFDPSLTAAASQIGLISGVIDGVGVTNSERILHQMIAGLTTEHGAMHRTHTAVVDRHDLRFYLSDKLYLQQTIDLLFTYTRTQINQWEKIPFANLCDVLYIKFMGFDISEQLATFMIDSTSPMSQERSPSEPSEPDPILAILDTTQNFTDLNTQLDLLLEKECSESAMNNNRVCNVDVDETTPSSLVLCDSTCYVMYRYLHMIYARLEFARFCARQDNSMRRSQTTQESELRYHKFFRSVMKQFDEDRSIDLYEDQLRKILGCNAYQLFTLHRVVENCYKKLHDLWDDKRSFHELLRLYLFFSHKLKQTTSIQRIKQLRMAYYLMALKCVGSDPLYSVEYYSKQHVLGISIVDKEAFNIPNHFSPRHSFIPTPTPTPNANSIPPTTASAPASAPVSVPTPTSATAAVVASLHAANSSPSTASSIVPIVPVPPPSVVPPAKTQHPIISSTTTTTAAVAPAGTTEVVAVSTPTPTATTSATATVTAEEEREPSISLSPIVTVTVTAEKEKERSPMQQDEPQS